MGIYIKGMEMPENCLISCPFTYFDEYGDEKRKCAFTDVNVLSDEAKNYCPIVEVPVPHGRLIDADALVSDKAWDADTRVGYVQVVDVGSIEEAPTIIEAEDK